MGNIIGRIYSRAKALGRHAFLVTLGAFVLVSAGTALHTPQVYAQDQDIQDLVLEVRMGQAIITYGAVVFETNQRYYLPLVDLAENFEFVITDSDISRGYVEGWYISEDNTFSVDRQNMEAFHNGERIELSEINFVDDPFGEGTDVYMQMEIFSQIWPEISFDVDLPTLTLKAESEATFPFMERKERGARQKMLEAQRAARAVVPPDLPYLNNPYGLIGKPVVDIETSANWKHYDRQMTAQTSINGVQDLAFMTAEYGLTLTRDEEGFVPPESMRLKLSRSSTPGEPLPFGVEKVELGDTRLTYRELVANGSGGRGFYFTTSKRDANREFDVITVEGTGPPGWEVELYRNNELIDFGFVDTVGEYRFEDVATQYGNNRIRVVLYGPQGQIREDVKDYNFAGSMLRPGEGAVTGGMVDADRDFVPLVKDEPRSTPRGVAKSLAGAFGLTRNITLFSGYNELPVNQGSEINEMKKYGSVGATFSTGGGFGQVEAYRGMGNGHALDLRFLTEVLGLRLNMAAAFYNNFESPSAGYGDNAKKQELELTAARTVRLPFGSLGLQFDANRIYRNNGNAELSFGTRQTIGRSGIQLTHQTDTRVLNNKHQNTSGSLTANARMRNWRLRGGLSYAYFPQAHVTNGNVELRYQTRDNFTAAVSMQNDFVQDLIGSGFQIGYDFKRFLGSFDANWMEQRGWEMMLRASTSLGPYGAGGGYDMVSESQRNQAPIEAHTFLDNDASGDFSEGDEPLAGARLNFGGRVSEEESDESGRLIARAGAVTGLTNVALDTSSLDDPYYAPAVPGYSMSLRPGSMPAVSFPVIETGAIDGTISSADDGEPVQGIRLQLVNDKNEIVAITEAAYDGFYTFEFVKPGTYIVRVDPSYKVNVPPETVTVVSDDLFASGVDLQLLEQVQETDGVAAGEDPDADADLESFEQEFEEALEEESAEGLTTVEPQSGAESGRVAQPYHETQNGTREPAPHSSDGTMSAIVHRVRIGEHPDRLRLVMELSGPVRYTVQEGDDPGEMVIDLPDVAWDALTVWRVESSPVIQSFSAEALVGANAAIEGTRIRLRGVDPVAGGQSGLLPPDEKSGHRLFVDFRKAE
ncbi:MAG: hypothetical protein HYS17_03850 [Micavibrio aeruginosavorus]|uniref:NOMO second beta-sandwich domain-containing protein n=1 Tax=Micavibrio aeruginosavorus TaxID=349221 RepID=A0A7T5R3P9_9BACT|nr:MAG: hypothetical protein HYS17_03850 [Micavibrio aeruginosavorus]